ncbi:MAG: hypothetical protein R3A78_13465 [Polyangiales bacterium]
MMVMLGIKYMLNTTPPPQPDREAEEEVVQEARPAALSTVEVALRGVPDRASVKLDGFPPANLPFRVRAGSHHVVGRWTSTATSLANRVRCADAWPWM